MPVESSVATVANIITIDLTRRYIDCIMTNSLIINSTGISGSLTNLADGSSYLLAGEGIAITSQSNGSVEIAASGGSAVSFVTASFTGSTTWTSPITGPVFITGFGGGGGGGGGYSTTGATEPGGGGGGGSLQSTVIVFVTSGSTYAVTIGTGGSGGGAEGDGGSGGDTTFGSLVDFGGAAGGGGAATLNPTMIGGGICVAGGTTAIFFANYSSNSSIGVGCSIAAGGWTHAFGGGSSGLPNCVGGFNGGNGGGTGGGVEAEQDLREMEPTVLAVVLDPTQLQTREQAEAEDHKEIPDTPAAMVAQAI